ncbi:MAG TPA: PASTA domain-containing protein, partial [Aeromicrobium sp.]|nr:PASTA domain-containing protein [Aeromicrobium sp.]
VSVYDQGTDGETTYLVMGYVPGRTLRDVMRDEAPMSPRRALSYLESVLMALAAAHDGQVIHRDIKPENVLISTTGEIKIADFGLARATDADSATENVLIGTVSYLAPEIITHQGADPRSDVYACGAMLYEMLTGSKPHVADSPIAVAHKHVNEDITVPSKAEPGIPPYLDALVLRAMARDRAQRPPDARVFLHQVRQVQRALAAGLADDPELTQDLHPGSGPTPAELPSFGPIGTGGEPTVAVFGQATASHVANAGSTEATTALAPAGTDQGTIAKQSADTPKPRPRRGPLHLFLAIAALAITGFAGWYLAVGRYDEVPNLVTLSQEEAIKTVEAAGFEAKVGPSEYSEVVEKGSVVAADPDAGSRLLPGETIVLTVSKGKERYKIPNIRGRTVEEASTILGSLNLTVGEVTEEFSDTVPKDGVISSPSHKVGDLVKRDTPVDLLVSKGPKPVSIPNYTSKSAPAAESALKKLGFEVKKTEQFSETVPAAKVISQTPSSGIGHRGDTITLVVSKGPERVSVPNLNGMTEAEATAAISPLGLKLNASRNPFSGDGARVRYQSPGTGSKVKRGSSVTVFLS